MKLWKDNRGATLIEAISALVIISIIIGVLSQGIITASSWFSEGTRIKNEGEEVADKVDGKTSAQVKATNEPVDLQIENGDGTLAIDKKHTDLSAYTYKDSDTTLKNFLTDVPDVAPGKSGYYTESRQQAAGTSTDMDTFIKSISSMTAERRTELGVQGGYQYNNSAVIKAWLQDGNEFPKVSQEFIEKHTLEEGGVSLSDLRIRCHFYNIGKSTESCLIYAGIGGDLSGSPWRAYMIYSEGYWYVAPREASNMKYINFQVTMNSTPNNITKMTTDDKGKIHVTKEASTEKCTCASDYETFVKNPDHGWQKLEPME